MGSVDGTAQDEDGSTEWAIPRTTDVETCRSCRGRDRSGPDRRLDVLAREPFTMTGERGCNATLHERLEDGDRVAVGWPN